MLLELTDEDEAIMTKDKSKKDRKDKKNKNDLGSTKKDKSNTNQKTDTFVTICHKPGTKTEQTMMVSESSLSGHLDHGDTRGPCP